MNERIKELAERVWPDPNISHVNHLKFAELIIRECCEFIEAGHHSMVHRLSLSKYIKKHFGIEE